MAFPVRRGRYPDETGESCTRETGAGHLRFGFLEGPHGCLRHENEHHAAGDRRCLFLGLIEGVYTQDLKARATGETAHVDGKFLTVLKQQDDGSWRIFRDCFNSNVPPK